MKVTIEYEVIDCRDCPFKRDYTGHGEWWAECTHKDNGKGAYENILWGCAKQFVAVPYWCPLGLGTATDAPQ